MSSHALTCVDGLYLFQARVRKWGEWGSREAEALFRLSSLTAGGNGALAHEDRA